MEIILLMVLLGLLFQKREPVLDGHYHIVNGETVYCKRPRIECDRCRMEDYAKYDVLVG